MTRYPLLYAALAVMLFALILNTPAGAARLEFAGANASAISVPSLTRNGIDLLAAGAVSAMLAVPCQIDNLLPACTLGSGANGAQFLAGERSYLRADGLSFMPAAGEFSAGDFYLPAATLAAELARLTGHRVTYANQLLTVTATRAAPVAVAAAQPATMPAALPPEVAATVSAAGPSRYQLRRIVIDAGHGGQDPGAVGNSLNEKDINLALALRTANQLRTLIPGVQVILTRSDDQFISLGGRPKIANDAQADLFISIHCNASVNANANGFEVYVLSAENTDNNARTVAALENAASFESEENRRQYNSSTLTMLERLRLTQYQQESVELAGCIKKQVVPRLGVDDRGVKSANFAVLRGALMPAVLIETAFISNADDAARLANPEYQEQVACGVANGVAAFRNQYEIACSR